MAMVRARRLAAQHGAVPAGLLGARARSPCLYADELAALAADGSGLHVEFVYTREPPPGWSGRVGRVRPDQLLMDIGGRSAESAFVCGPTGFVEAAADMLADGGLPGNRIRTERFGPTGG